MADDLSWRAEPRLADIDLDTLANDAYLASEQLLIAAVRTQAKNALLRSELIRVMHALDDAYAQSGQKTLDDLADGIMSALLKGETR